MSHSFAQAYPHKRRRKRRRERWLISGAADGWWFMFPFQIQAKVIVLCSWFLIKPLTWWFCWVTGPCSLGETLLMSQMCMLSQMQNSDGIWTQYSTKKVPFKLVKCLKMTYWKGFCMWWIPHRSSFYALQWLVLDFILCVLHLLLLVFVLTWKIKTMGRMFVQEYFEGFFSS